MSEQVILTPASVRVIHVPGTTYEYYVLKAFDPTTYHPDDEIEYEPRVAHLTPKSVTGRYEAMVKLNGEYILLVGPPVAVN